MHTDGHLSFPGRVVRTFLVSAALPQPDKCGGVCGPHMLHGCVVRTQPHTMITKELTDGIIPDVAGRSPTTTRYQSVGADEPTCPEVYSKRWLSISIFMISGPQDLVFICSRS